MHHHARTADLRVEPTRDREHGVADGFAFEAAQVHAVEQFILGVELFGAGVGWGAGHLVSPRQHQLADEPLHGPVQVADEVDGEMVEQFAVRRRLAEHAEVVHGWHEAAAEEVVPDAVHDDAGGEGIGGVNDMLREFETAAAGGEGLRLCSRERFEEAAGRALGRVARLAAHEEKLVHAAAIEHRGRGHGDGLNPRDQLGAASECGLRGGGELQALGAAGRAEEVEILDEPVGERGVGG